MSSKLFPLIVDERLAMGRRQLATESGHAIGTVAEFVNMFHPDSVSAPPELFRIDNLDATPHNLRVFSVMSPNAYAEFQETGQHSTFTEREWGYRTDESERLLFGGPCRTDLMYAVLFHDAMKHVLALDVLNGMADSFVNPKVIEWKPCVLEDASFTLGTADQNIIAFRWWGPETMGRVVAFYINYLRATKFGWPKDGMSFDVSGSLGLLSPQLRAFVSAAFEHPRGCDPYTEIQVHRTLTPAEVLSVHDFGKLRQEYEA